MPMTLATSVKMTMPKILRFDISGDRVNALEL